MVQINFQQLRDYLSVFEPGFPIQKGYVAQLLFQHSIPDVFRKVKAIVTAAEPNKNLHEGSLRSRLNLFKKFIISRKNWLIKEWPTRIELLLEPFLITFRCHHLPSALKSTPSAATSSEDPEQTSTQIPVEWMQFPQSPDTQIHSDLTQTPDTQIHSELPQSPDTQIHSDLTQIPVEWMQFPQSPDTQIHSDLTQIPVEWMQFPQSPDTQIHSELPQTPDTLIQSDNLQTSTPVQTAPPNISQSCSATCSSQSPMTLKKSCASCVAKQRTNMNMLQDNKRLHHQLKDLKTLFRAEKGNFSLKRFNEIIKRKTESMTLWKNRYATLKVSNNTQQLLESVYSLEQKVKTLEEKLIAAQEESLNMTSVIEQLKSMHEKTENYDAHLKHVSSYSPSPNIYTHTAVEENRTIVHNSHSSVCVREGVLSARASKDQIITTKNMVEDVCYRQDVRSEEESNEHTHKEAAESVIIIDYQVMMARVKNNHNNQCSEDLHQGRNNKLLEQGLSAGQKTPQQNVADIVVSRMNSRDKTLASQKTPQQNVADIVISSPNSLDKTLASQKTPQQNVADIVISSPNSLDKTLASQKTPQQNVADIVVSSMNSFDKTLTSQKTPQQNVADIVISSPNSLEKTLASQKSCQPSVVHLGKRHTIGNKCGSFGRTFKENSFQKHRLTHTEDKLYKCDVCGRKFTQDSLLKIHKRAHKGHKPYKCDVCGRGFSVKVYLKIHTRTHTGEKPYKCDVCGRGFSWSGNRDVHKQSHVIERPYECDACGLCFTQQCSLEIHTRTHVSRTPFKCKVCSLEFEEKADMRTHKLVHKGEKNIVCDICGKRFRRQCDLTLHNRKHTGEKPYQCNVCGRGFAYSNVLKSHERIHSEERPYQCDVCGFAFRQSSSLNTHKLIHTGVKPYACDICGFQVNRKDNLRLHKKVHKT